VRRVHIIGRKNSGKTTLIVELVHYFVARGLKVGTIKHTHHQHELDTPGKDSHRHRVAGASVVGILSGNLTAAFVPCDPDLPRERRYDILAPLYETCNLVLVEGDMQSHAPRVEVWRSATGQEPIAAKEPGVAAVISDEPVAVPVKRLPKSDLAAIAAFLLSLVNQSDRT